MDCYRTAFSAIYEGANSSQYNKVILGDKRWLSYWITYVHVRVPDSFWISYSLRVCLRCSFASLISELVGKEIRAKMDKKTSFTSPGDSNVFVEVNKIKISAFLFQEG
jgi:hypothetical protein